MNIPLTSLMDETGELRLNTENLKDKKNVSVEWEVGYRTEEDENGNDQFTAASDRSDVLVRKERG